MTNAHTPPTPDDQGQIPENAQLRRADPNVIDQRQQQIDPAGHHRADVNAGAGDGMKQPGSYGDPHLNMGWYQRIHFPRKLLT